MINKRVDFSTVEWLQEISKEMLQYEQLTGRKPEKIIMRENGIKAIGDWLNDIVSVKNGEIEAKLWGLPLKEDSDLKFGFYFR